MSSAEEYLLKLKSIGATIRKPSNQIGGNSVFYRIDLRGQEFVIKVYQGNHERVFRSRMREIRALQFLESNNFNRIPKVHVELSPDDGVCLDFIRGKNPKENLRTTKAITRAVMELKQLFKRNGHFPDAIDACFSTQDVLNQIELRMSSLEPSISERLQTIVRELASFQVMEFPRASHTYSFSDIGSHNMIARFGSYWFLDMEFFGRDSAVKMMIDYLIHPRNRVTQKSARYLIDRGCKEFGIDGEMLLLSVPYFAAKWAAIVARRINNTSPNDLEVKDKLNKYFRLSSLREIASIRNEILNLR